jgi:WD40 repeat protein
MTATTLSHQCETGHQDTVHDAQFDYYGKHVATCSSDRLIKIFSVSSNSQGGVRLLFVLLYSPTRAYLDQSVQRYS